MKPYKQMCVCVRAFGKRMLSRCKRKLVIHTLTSVSYGYLVGVLFDLGVEAVGDEVLDRHLDLAHVHAARQVQVPV